MTEADPDLMQKLKRRHNRDLRYARAEGMLQGVLSMLRPGDVVVDCGANQGDVTGSLADTGAILHAFEPLIDFPAFLRGLIATHGRVAFVKMDIEGAELDLLEAMQAQGLFDDIQLTVAETHERKFKDLRPRFAALRGAIAAAHPVTRVNLDWI